MTQLFALHSAYGLTTAAAALDAGLIDGSGPRILLTVNSARVPETAVGIDVQPNLATLRERFDRVESLDALLAPLHPSSWDPAEADLPLLNRLLVRAWALESASGDELELFVQSPQVAPAHTLMSLFPSARITIIGDGLMTYSPIRVQLPRTVVERIERVVYADVVPGVTPLVFAEADTAPVPIPAERFRDALAETFAPDARLDALADGTPTALVLGQYLAALGLMKPEEEIALQQRMVDRAAAWNPARIVFKPHPAAPPAVTGAVRERAVARGMAFAEYRGAQSAEAVAERLDVTGVVAGFSTALPTVQTLFGRTIGTVGTDEVLTRLTPFENSNRVPATIVDALTRPDSPYRDPEALQLLIDAVGYAMQPEIVTHLRPRAVELLGRVDASERERYFTAERLAALRLPGAPRETRVQRMLRSDGGIGRIEQVRLTVKGARRRASRAWKVVRGR